MYLVDKQHVKQHDKQHDLSVCTSFNTAFSPQTWPPRFKESVGQQQLNRACRSGANSLLSICQQQRRMDNLWSISQLASVEDANFPPKKAKNFNVHQSVRCFVV
jgi:hypothetical protein